MELTIRLQYEKTASNILEKNRELEKREAILNERLMALTQMLADEKIAKDNYQRQVYELMLLLSNANKNNS